MPGGPPPAGRLRAFRRIRAVGWSGGAGLSMLVIMSPFRTHTVPGSYSGWARTLVLSSAERNTWPTWRASWRPPRSGCAAPGEDDLARELNAAMRRGVQPVPGGSGPGSNRACPTRTPRPSTPTWISRSSPGTPAVTPWCRSPGRRAAGNAAGSGGWKAASWSILSGPPRALVCAGRQPGLVHRPGGRRRAAGPRRARAGAARRRRESRGKGA